MSAKKKNKFSVGYINKVIEGIISRKSGPQRKSDTDVILGTT